MNYRIQNAGDAFAAAYMQEINRNSYCQEEIPVWNVYKINIHNEYKSYVPQPRFIDSFGTNVLVARDFIKIGTNVYPTRRNRNDGYKYMQTAFVY